ncbi:hypothetical protein D3P08_23900 [Paenibacillus nanensis]|uniref:Uncharacterized protein n=1 Tax=Paenibacillus nanensis TaxID=393251 RepID=A0A3A1UMX2_9BACL|nr:hypothetical protein [Paenibacillus nanensis]RIX48740.1 hypothetical protein D3P08_23900 [Paenibacillus nanensis]
MRKTVSVIIVLLCWSWMLPNETFALKCAEPPLIEEAYEVYDGIVLAEVDAIRVRGDHRALTLTVLEGFKGISDDRLKVVEDLNWGASEKEEPYLFFLKQSADGSWEVPLCSGARKASDSADHLEFLRNKTAADTPIVVPVIDISSLPTIDMSKMELHINQAIPADNSRGFYSSLAWLAPLGAGLLVLAGLCWIRYTKK